MSKELDNSNKKYWNKVWIKDSYSTESLRKIKASKKVDILLSNIILDKDSEIIDLGCGGGYISEEIYSRTLCNVVGIDFSDSALNTATQRLGNRNYPIKFIKNNVCKTEQPTNGFDLVICSGILEHVPNPELLLQEIKRLLKPGGQFFITSSNMLSLIWPHRLIKQLMGTWHYGFQKNYHPQKLKKFITDSELEVTYEGALTSLGDFPLIGYIDSLLHKICKKWGRYTIIIGRKI